MVKDHITYNENTYRAFSQPLFAITNLGLNRRKVMPACVEGFILLLTIERGRLENSSLPCIFSPLFIIKAAQQYATLAPYKDSISSLMDGIDTLYAGDGRKTSYRLHLKDFKDNLIQKMVPNASKALSENQEKKQKRDILQAAIDRNKAYNTRDPQEFTHPKGRGAEKYKNKYTVEDKKEYFKARGITRPKKTYKHRKKGDRSKLNHRWSRAQPRFRT